LRTIGVRQIAAGGAPAAAAAVKWIARRVERSGALARAARVFSTGSTGAGATREAGAGACSA
jgi:hypothetical protein